MSLLHSLRLLGGVRWTQCRAISSALFVSDRSPDVRPILSPNLNFASKFENVGKLQKNVDTRGLKAEVADLKTLWESYAEMKQAKNALESQRISIAAEIKSLKKSKLAADLEKVEGRILLGRMVREDLKRLMQPYWEIEERLMVACLALPNDLHEDTPLGENKIIFQSSTLTEDFPPEDHLQIGKHLIDYRNPHWYYLKEFAAHFDAAVMYYFFENLKSKNFTPVVAPDFCHTAVVEGCQISTDNAIRLSEENINIVGGASVMPFCTLYCRKEISSFPVKHVSAGKNYILSDGPGLFGAWQRTRVGVFEMASNVSDINQQFRGTLKELTNLYSNLAWDFRVVLICAPNLKPWESLRASFQMFSPSLQSFIEVGNLSLSGSFISERLSINCVDNSGQKGFCQILSGHAVDVTSVLACLLEQNVSDLLNEPLKPYTFYF